SGLKDSLGRYILGPRGKDIHEIHKTRYRKTCPGRAPGIHAAGETGLEMGRRADRTQRAVQFSGDVRDGGQDSRIYDKTQSERLRVAAATRGGSVGGAGG